MMKVALISNNLPPIIDGVGDFTDLLSAALSNRGVEVIMICKKGIQVKQANVNVKVYPVVSKWDHKGFEAALEILQHQQPEYIFFQYVPYAFNKWGIPLGLMGIVESVRKIGLVCMVFHETFIRTKFWPLQTFPVSMLQRYMLKNITKNIFASVTSIDRYALQLKKIGFSPVHLVPIPANIEKIQILPERMEKLKKKLAEENSKIIVAFGKRNYDLLISSFLKAYEKRKDIKLLILGAQDKNYGSVHKNISVTGELTRPEIFEYLSAADLYISFDSVKNGKGGSSSKSGSMASAIAAGLPTIGFKGDMNNELLLSIPDLFLIEFDQPSITDAILTYIGHPKSQGNISFWEKYLSFDAVADFYIESIMYPKDHQVN